MCKKKVWLEDYEACSLLCLAIAHFFVSHRLGRFRQSSEEQSNLASLTSFPQSLTSLAATEAFVPLSTSLVAIPFLIFWLRPWIQKLISYDPSDWDALKLT